VRWWGPAVAVVAVLLRLWGDSSSRLRSQRTIVTAPDGTRFDVLVHREGVPLYTHVPRFGALSIGMFATAWAVVRRRRHNPWAVTVRQSPYQGRHDLLHELCGGQDAAHERANEVSRAVQSGQRLWDQSLER
jgi:hypothetical protein